MRSFAAGTPDGDQFAACDQFVGEPPAPPNQIRSAWPVTENVTNPLLPAAVITLTSLGPCCALELIRKFVDAEAAFTTFTACKVAPCCRCRFQHRR